MNVLERYKNKLTEFLSDSPSTKKLISFVKPKAGIKKQERISNDSFFDLFYQSLAPMLLVEPQANGNHTIVDANKAAELFYGYSHTKFLKLHVGDINIQNQEDRQKLMKKALKNSATIFEFTHKLANKELKNVQVFSSPILIEERKLMFLIIHDITDQNKAIQEIKEQEDYARMLFNQSPDGLYIIDEKGTVIDGNKNLEQLVGIKINKLIGKTVYDTKLLTETDHIHYMERMHKILKGGSTEIMEYVLHRPDGSQIHVEGNAELIKYKGADYLLGTMRDTTARKQQELQLKESEAKYKYLADFTFEWEYWLSPEGHYKYISPSCEKTTGYPVSAFENNPLLLIEIAHPDDEALIRKYFTAEAADQAPHQLEFRILKPDGEVVWIEHNCHSIFDPEGKYLGKRGINRNITKEKMALQSLEESKERFRKLSQLTFKSILIHKQGIIVDINQAFEELSGFKREELIGQSFSEFIKNANKKESIEKQINKAKTKPFETCFTKKDGTQIPVEIEAKDYLIDGETMGVGAIRDITAKKEALHTLLLLNKALDNSREVVFTTDKEGVFNYINSEFTNLYGFTKEDVIGKETPRILKSDQTSKEMYTEFWAKLSRKESLSTTYKNKTKNGNLIDVEASADPILDENGSIVGFLAIQRDITEKKKRELRHSVVSSITKAVIQEMNLESLLKIIQSEINKLMDARNFYFAFYDKNTDNITIPYYSDDFEENTFFPAKGSLTGYLIEQKKSMLISLKELEKLRKSNIVQGVGKDASVWLGVPLTRKDEVIGAFAIQSYTDENAYSEEDQTTLEVIASQISIAMERKYNEENLRVALAKAQESDRLKFTFLATMSHELRTPLNAIIGFSDLVEENRPIDEILSFSQIINKSGHHLLGIVNEIFDFTLIETGEIKLSYDEYNLKEILNDVYQIIDKERFTLHKEHISFSYHIPPKATSLIIKSDKQRLQQILINLLKNALKFTDAGFIKFGFNLIKDKDNALIQFYVEDTGIGIAAEKEKIIFDVFRQADESNTRKHDGVGLGLAISKKIVELLGGELWLKSKIGEGSTFFFNLPCPFLLEGQQSIFEEFDTIPNYNHQNQTILIAEDDPTNYALLEVMLEPFHVNLLWAKNGKEALDIFNGNPNINLVLVDIKMPKLNGIEVTKFIKKMNPRIPVIVHTAYSNSVDKELSFKAGCDDYITKPFQKADLFRLIRKYLD